MLKLQQLQFEHKPEENKFGDCWRASIACLLHLPVETVPNPYENGLVPYEVGEKILNEFLSGFNLRLIEFPLSDGVSTDFGRMLGPDVHWFLLGQSSAGKHNHFVIVRGEEIVHSTSPATVIGPDLETGLYWAAMLVYHRD